MKQQFVINGYIAHSEQDDFAEGCKPETCKTIFEQNFRMTAENFPALLQMLADEFSNGTGLDNFLANSCDEMGRLDLQVMQIEPFHVSKLARSTMNAWRNGNRVLWATCYSFKIEIVQTEVDLSQFLTG